VTCRAAIGPSHEIRHQVGTQLALSQHQVRILEVARDPRPISDLLRISGRSDRTKFRDQVLRPLLDAGFLAMTISDNRRVDKGGEAAPAPEAAMEEPVIARFNFIPKNSSRSFRGRASAAPLKPAYDERRQGENTEATGVSILDSKTSMSI